MDWRSGSNGVVMVFGNGSQMRDDLTALELRCLQQLDFQRELHEALPTPMPQARPRLRPSPSPALRGPRPQATPSASRAPPPPARLDADRRAL
ncbi:hypothetical protein [Arenimonas sp. MALMAid1274]|uniref:hypothetical protein n=1 Tax=Arenimonas sp. MALMAid1274 TaxID=3411630 RepID=UPI003B9EDA05